MGLPLEWSSVQVGLGEPEGWGNDILVRRVTVGPDVLLLLSFKLSHLRDGPGGHLQVPLAISKLVGKVGSNELITTYYSP